MTKLWPGHWNCGNYSEGHQGHDEQETPKKDVVGIKTARTCHVTIMVSHFCHNLKKYFFEISGLVSFKSVFLRSYLRTESKYDRTIRLDSYVVLVTYPRIISYASKINQKTKCGGGHIASFNLRWINDKVASLTSSPLSVTQLFISGYYFGSFLSTLKDYRTFLDNRTFFIELLVIFRVKPAKLPNLSVRQFAVCSPDKWSIPNLLKIRVKSV